MAGGDAAQIVAIRPEDHADVMVARRSLKRPEGRLFQLEMPALNRRTRVR
jgi:hypothetical protein